MTEQTTAPAAPGIAIIGMAGRIPGAKTLDHFWQNPIDGVDSISRFQPEDLEVSPASRQRPGYVAVRSILENVDRFDAAFFGIYPKEAEQMDPQHRIFLECCWEALESGGYDPARYPGMIGLYAGSSMNTYFMRHLARDRSYLERFTEDYQAASYTTMLGNDKDFLPTRVSFKLNLRGPSVAVQTACSTSLVAICQACQSLLTYGCDMALAGAISITFPQRRGYIPEEGGIVSTDGVVRPFDHRAQGTVFGSGAGVVLLKRIEDALADGDQILAVIRGFAMNNDGAAKAGYTAPSAQGQFDVIAAAQAMAGFAPESISYIETHGTGTPLGDPIEVAALARIFDGSEQPPGSCLLGTAKANVGHLDVAAGVTGLIKTVLQMQHRTIPGLLHFERLNPQIQLSHSPLGITSKTTPWHGNGYPLRAGVSAFGVGGTNAHVVLEEPPSDSRPGPAAGSDRPALLLLSARSEDALRSMRLGLADHLAQHSEIALSDAAFTLAAGRARHPIRVALVAKDRDAAVEQLRGVEAPLPQQNHSKPKIVFVFPGQGAQAINMARNLYRTETVFRDAMERCDAMLRPLLGESILAAIYPEQASEAATARLTETRLAQPAIFAVEYALAQLWISLGIEPALLIGHSIGEYAAACLSGSLSLQEALELVAVRGALMQHLPTGSMLAVRANRERLLPFLSDDVSLAAINAPSSLVVSGPHGAIDALFAALTAAGIATKKLQTSHAFHSGMVEPALPPFRQHLDRAHFLPPAIPWISTLTAAMLSSDEVADPAYWLRQLREPVAFAAALEAARDHLGKDAVFLEIGPSANVLGLMRQTLASSVGGHRILTSLPNAAVAEPPRDHGADLTPALAQLWMLGAEPDWGRIFAVEEGHRPQRVSLPTYPFERKRYWVEAPPSSGDPALEASPSPSEALHANPAVASHSQLSQEILMPVSDLLVAELKTLVAELSDLDLAAVPPTTSFVELGLDSLFLTQLTQSIRGKYGVKLTFRQIMGDLGTFQTLAEHLRPHAKMSSPPQLDVTPAPPNAPVIKDLAAATAAATVAATAAARATSLPLPREITPAVNLTPGLTPDFAALFSQQVQAVTELMHRQLNLIEGTSASLAALNTGATPAAPVVTPSQTSAPAPFSSTAAAPLSVVPVVPAAGPPDKNEATLGTLVPLKPLELRTEDPLTRRQREHVESLQRTYTARTAGSKQHVERFRDVLADPRVASGFHPQWKEMVYPLVIERSAGAYLWDKDGHRYIDILNGYGSILFGHSPKFVTDAVRQQLDRGFPIGPQTELAGECAELLASMTGMERVTFCNTGSEAVMAALRLARTVTGRSLVVLFSGAYHGMMDEVLVKSTRAERSIPAAPGIPRESVANMLVLEYGSPQALDVIRRRKDEIAAVLVEPVQSRHPALQPIAFLKEIRQITVDAGAALIFDEVVTGFRTHPGGAQELFGIRADMATYGKVVAGGMPIGVVAGSRTFMDALDGGAWRFGDDSFPQVGVTFFAGTFVRHPLTMAAVRAVLQHLKASGSELQQCVGRKSAALAHDVRELFSEFGFSSTLENFSSWLFFPPPPDLRLGRLLYYHLRARGIHLQEGFPCFLTTAHTDEDLAEVRRGFRSALESMAEGEALPSRTTSIAVATASQAQNPFRRVAVLDETLPSSGTAPITESQREILLASQLDDDASCAFNESVSLTLRGALHLDALESSLRALITRHEVLRLRVSPDGEQVQVESHVEIPHTRLDLRQFDTAEQDRCVAELLGTEASTPFPLAIAPLARVTLIQRSNDWHTLVLTAHHIVLDGWSMNVLFNELGELYSAAVEGRSPHLPPARSFLDHARQEHAHITSSDHRETEAFWLQQFKQPVSPLDLPTDRPRSALRSNRGATYKHVFSAAFTTLLRESSQRSGSTLFITLLSGFAALLSRLGQTEDLVISVPMAGQREVEGESLVGHCVNFLPLRFGATGEKPFGDLLRETRTAVFDAMDHQRFTLGTLLQKLKLPRNPARLDLAEVQFNLEQVGVGLHFKNLEAKLEANPKAAVNADLFFNFIDRGTDLVLDCDYNSSLFLVETIARWIGSLESILRDAAQDPAKRLCDLAVLTDEQRQQMLVEWNQTSSSYPRDASIPEVFRRQAAATPDAVALTFETTSLSYRELDEQSDQFATTLLSMSGQASRQGASPDQDLRVALSMERAPELIIAILGILKAGATYVPVDPTYPDARLALLLEDASPQLLLTQQRFEERLRGLAQPTCEVVAVERIEWQAVGNQQPASPTHCGPESPAYMMYTSGSTGRPKGVVVPHRAVLRLVQNTDFATFGPEEVFLQLAPISFDASTLEIWGALLNGGRLVLMPGSKPSPEEIGTAIQHYGITTLWLTAALFHLMVMDHLDQLKPLRQLLAGGDVLSVAHVRKLLTAAPHLRLINGYGPTENTTFTCCHTIRLEDLERGTVPIGRPIANTRVYILDPLGRPAPIGVPGELHAAGDGLALGYLHAPELTATKFITLDLGTAATGRICERLYKTGDLARYASDGTVEFLGRRDNQIKIRGYRVELGEIEAAAEQYPDVRAVIVCARPDWMSAEDIPGDKRLALYAIPRDGMDPSEVKRGLREYLRGQLPDHMQPQAIMLLASFPRTANGKVDYRALPAPEAERALRTQPEDTPRTEVEGKLAAIWSKVLHVPAIGIHDSIFELGGDSLSIFRITTQANQQGIRLTAKHVFQYKTIAALSPQIEAEDDRKGARENTISTIQAVNRDRFRKVQNSKQD
ncbi:MAG: amino acid adenylation domain-containing protein [Acidobacteriaceae bacterium]